MVKFKKFQEFFDIKNKMYLLLGSKSNAKYVKDTFSSRTKPPMQKNKMKTFLNYQYQFISTFDQKLMVNLYNSTLDNLNNLENTLVSFSVFSLATN